MYKHAASLFANDLFDELTSSGILDDKDIWCGQTDKPASPTESPKVDRNFILWSLIPFIAAWSGKDLMDKSISFDEVATGEDIKKMLEKEKSEFDNFVKSKKVFFIF